jgi:hypothetical protein
MRISENPFDLNWLIQRRWLNVLRLLANSEFWLLRRTMLDVELPSVEKYDGETSDPRPEETNYDPIGAWRVTFPTFTID